ELARLPCGARGGRPARQPQVRVDDHRPLESEHPLARRACHRTLVLGDQRVGGDEQRGAPLSDGVDVIAQRGDGRRRVVRVHAEGRFALSVDGDEGHRRLRARVQREPLEPDAVGGQPATQPPAPAVVPGAAGQRDRRPEPRCGRGDVGDHAAEVRDELRGVREILDGTLADEVDERLAKQQDGHEADGIVRRRMPTAQIGDQLVHWIAAGDAPILYVHGVPNGARMWEPFLARTGGVAVDLPGFGESGKRGDLDASFQALGRFVGEFADHLGLERVRLCLHDWGAVGLLWAMREPERVERIVLMDTVPFLPGYRWHFIARQWRRRVIGELAMGSTIRPVAKRLLPAPLVDQVLANFDAGTQRTILRLYRSAPEAALARAGLDLGLIDCPALIIWGGRDPYISVRFAEAYREALGGDTQMAVAPDAGHWPWLQDPELVVGASEFLLR
ncbi:MAG: hypothetical protein QOG68_47, partial [Solirubrobacteraceae bacterium]|nr:hypothetical protein [Solirubrobacteraceae bacterium]